MLRVKDIQEALLPLIGWKQSYNTEEVSIAEELTTSESGLYFQQAHPLLTLTNLACIAPVSFVNGTSQARTKVPETVPAPLDQFSAWLKSKTEDSIIRAVTRFYNEKLIAGAARSLCENKTLFDGAGRLCNLIKNKSNVVGLEIVPIRAKGISTRINRIGLQFTTPGTYTVYLMHSSSYEPVEKVELEVNKKFNMNWFKVDWLLPYQKEGLDAGGSWYVVYSQNELPEGSQAICKDRDWSKGPCGACSRSEELNWKVWSRYLEIYPFSVNSELVPTEEDDLLETSEMRLWDIENNIYDYATNYGLNLDVSVACDYTDFIIEQRHLFQDIIFKQVAIDFLKEFAYNANTRTNRNSINASKLDILMALDGTADEKGNILNNGLSKELDTAIKAIKLSTEGIDRVCQPCVNNGVRYRSV